ncbi:MAG TPA: ATP-binding protein, partial [Planctomycetota bacterium]|nr:ATP-binding protein [Planctomycetota bacterium]
QLLQAQKMEAIGKLAGGVAHDFNNLLMVISGRAELIANRSAEGTPVRRDADLISETAGRAARLTRQLLAFSRRQPFAARDLDLNEVVGDMATMLRSLIGEDIEFVIELGRDLPKVISDPSHIEQVVLNLVVNARDAMAHGGRLTLATRMVVSDGRDPKAPPSGRHVALQVSDTGVGMDEATRLHIFEPFFTTKAAGTGLGLSTVYGIVQQSGGHVAVDSAPGVGTTFTICLPAIAAAPARVRTPPDGTRLRESGHAGATVLVVEDEEHVRELLREILEDNGFKVLSAARPSEAVAQLQRTHVDLLVTDLVMPQTGGRELAERLRVLTPDLRVLFMSGYADVRPEAGEARLLAKPFTAHALIDAVNAALDTAAAG